MTASTIEHPQTRPLQPTQPTPADDLTREHEGRRFPVAGDWIIGRGQQVSIARHGVRRRRLEAAVLDGVFRIGDDPIASSLVATLQVADSAVTVELSPATVRSLTVGYHGVFGRRQRRLIWLEVRAELAPSAIPQLRGRGPIVLHAHLNLEPSISRRLSTLAIAERAPVHCVWHLYA